MITMRKKGTRTLLWYYAHDQKTKVVNEIKCCDCFFDIMLVFEERFLNLIGENDVDNEILEKTFLDFCVDVDAKDQDVFMIFAEVCIVMCEKTIIILVLDLKILIFGMRNYLEYLFRLCKFHVIKT